MFAIIQIGSTQFKVSEGDVINANRMPDEKGASVVLDKVLMYVNGDDVRVGTPYLKDVKVTAKVGTHPRGPKVVAFKFRRRKNYARKVGHRQDLTALNITKIAA